MITYRHTDPRVARHLHHTAVPCDKPRCYAHGYLHCAICAAAIEVGDPTAQRGDTRELAPPSESELRALGGDR